jgi:hypothetical protein
MNKKLFVAVLALALVTLACAVPLPSAGGNTSSGGNQVLFHDDFSDQSGGWSTSTTQNGVAEYGSGGLRIRVDTPQYDKWSHPSKNFSDVRVEVDAVKQSGPDKNDIGIICRYKDSDNFYYGVIGNDGYVMIITYVNGQDTTLAEDQTDGVVNAGSATNHVRFDCVGSTLTLYANGKQVATGTDSSLSSGDIGLIVGTYEDGGVDVVFNNFFVYKP